jgi:hypothetical protein
VTECRNLSCGEKTVGSGDCAQRDEICFGTVLTILGVPASTAESNLRCCFGPDRLAYSAPRFSFCSVKSPRSRLSRAVPRGASLLPTRAGRVVGFRFSLSLLPEASSRSAWRPRRSHRAHEFPQPRAKRSGAQSRFELAPAGVPTLPGRVRISRTASEMVRARGNFHRARREAAHSVNARLMESARSASGDEEKDFGREAVCVLALVERNLRVVVRELPPAFGSASQLRSLQGSHTARFSVA